MTDEPKHVDPFKPQDPTIPGVTGNAARLRPALQPPAPLGQGYQQRTAHSQNIFADPRVIVAIALAAVLLLGFGLFWHNHSASAEVTKPAEGITAAVSPPAAAPAAAAEPAKPVSIGPGQVASVAELAKPWSSKRFVFRAPQTADDVPALVVHLPGNIYWGLSMREPFGSCEMRYITDLAQIENEYHYTAAHPMVVDPCNHAVYDLEKYGPGPNGVVRGAIVSGAGVRPPLAIEMKARGNQIVAVQIEQ
jgi:hypothetical protein